MIRVSSVAFVILFVCASGVHLFVSNGLEMIRREVKGLQGGLKSNVKERDVKLIPIYLLFFFSYSYFRNKTKIALINY